ncbi:MAG TPA: hypothetical protein GX513_00080 [Firmicutes bacterium]|nr:hypothetical protein [Bacillota bacterium]
MIRRFLPHAGMVVWLALLFFTLVPVPRAGAQSNIHLDGRFDDWEGQARLEDPADQPESAPDDVAFFYWGTNEDDPNMYFMAQRYPPGHSRDAVLYRLYLDMDNDGVFEEPGDFRLEVYYLPLLGGMYEFQTGEFLTPKVPGMPDLHRLPGASAASQNGTGLVVAVLYSYAAGGSPVWWDWGWWGDSAASGGLRCEWCLPFEQVGHIPGQVIRMFLTAQPLGSHGHSGSGHGNDHGGEELDRVPDEGDIQWAPIPALGWPGLALLFTAGSALVWVRARRTWGQNR